MPNSHMEFPLQAAGLSHPSSSLLIFPSGTVSGGLIPQPFLTPSCPALPPPFPLSLGGAGSWIFYWALWGELGLLGRALLCLLSLSSETMAGNPGQPELPREGALRGPHCSGPINSGNSGSEWKEMSKTSGLGLSAGFPRPGRGGMLLESSWKAPGGLG